MLHETIWIGPDARTSPPQSHWPVVARHKYGRGRQARGCVCVECVTMVSRAPRGWCCCAGTEEGIWPTAKTAQRQSDCPMEHFAKGGTSLWLSERSLDLEENQSGNSKGVWSNLPPRPRLENVAQGRLELPGSRTPVDSARRTQDCTLEASQMAGYKKKSKDLVPTSSSSMRAASCSFRHAAGPGGRKGTHPLLGTITSTIGFRRLVRSQCPPSESEWASTCVFKKRTSTPCMPRISCACSCVTCMAQWSSFGTMGEFIVVPLFGNCASNFLGCTWNISQATHRNSTPLNGYGPISKPTWATCSFSTLAHYETYYTKTNAASRTHNIYFVHLLKAPIFPQCLDSPSITYANRNK